MRRTSRSSSRVQGRAAVAGAVLLALGLAACSSGSEQPSQAAPEPSSSASATASPGASASASPGGSASASPGGSAGAGATPTDTPFDPASYSLDSPGPELPRGGRRIFPDHIVVGYYGSAARALGVLGEGAPDAAAKKLEKAAAKFEKPSGRKVLPAFEFIATVASAGAGKDGKYSSYVPEADIQRYLDTARANKQIMILDIQPGRNDWMTQVRKFEKFLVQPDVGLALDPEWKLKPNERHLRQIGSTTAAEVNEVSAYLSDLTVRNNLPEKLFIVHQFRATMIKNRDKLVDRPGLATTIHIDGFGTQQVKKDVFKVLAPRTPELHVAFKLFYDEDTDMMTPKEAMALRPRPELITYQ